MPCWVREMSDEDAYMALALNNAQGELSELEVGLHALGAVETGVCKSVERLCSRTWQAAEDDCGARTGCSGRCS